MEIIGRDWEFLKAFAVIFWPIRFVLLIMLALTGVFCLPQAQDALFGAVIEGHNRWLVFGATIRTAWTKPIDPGFTPALTALEEEGFAEVTSKQIVEDFARNFMHALDVWKENGFSAAIASYRERLARESQQSCEIDENGDLLVRPASGGATERQILLPKLGVPAWLDLAYREPS